MPDFHAGDSSLLIVHQAAGVLRELVDLPIERALQLLQVLADLQGYDVREVARVIVCGASREAFRRHAWRSWRGGRA